MPITHIRFHITVIAVIFTALLIASCGKDEASDKSGDTKKPDSKTTESKSQGSTGEKPNPGKELFYSKSKENNIACSDCHGDGSNSSNTLTKYFSGVAGADKRPSTYHGKFSGADVASNAGGGTVCWEAYLRMKSPLSASQITDLNQYYSSLPGADKTAEIKYETIALPKPDKAKLKEAQKKIMALTGDPVSGESKFNDACGMCHGEKKTVRKVPDIFDEFDGNVKSITYNVRFGDGAMPFYKESVLSDQDVADIAAYILRKNGK